MAEDYRRVADLIEAAHAVPLLRQMFPYTSHLWLTFSTCTGYPYDRGLPHVGPRQGGYIVLDRYEGDVTGAAGDAESAITILLAHLPADIGAAKAGTVDDP